MYLLRFLQSPSSQDAETIDVEYRLACSGELYNRRVQTFDWRKSDATRVLLRAPLELFVVSRSFADYPQELCARMTLSYVTEQATGNVRASAKLLPDEDVMEDLCSILSLLSRRLISPVAKTRERHTNDPYLGSHTLEFLGSYASDLPAPILPPARIAFWSRRPLTVITSMEGQRVVDNSPPPVGVDPEALSEFLLKLPTVPGAVEIVNASRLYRAALELIESRPDIAYQLLISTVESLANVAFGDYEPEESEKLATQLAVQQRARDFGLDEERVTHLALDACKGQGWLKRKFKKFVLDFASLDELGVKDRVFLVPENFCPPKEDVPKALGRIYDVRSGNLHVASPFPKSVGIGTSPWIKISQMPIDWLEQLEVPPVPWFERVVSLAAQKFLIEKSSITSAPFLAA